VVPRVILDDLSAGDRVFDVFTAKAASNPLLRAMNSIPLAASRHRLGDLSHFLREIVGHPLVYRQAFAARIFYDGKW
jgi:hypothetical protein